MKKLILFLLLAGFTGNLQAQSKQIKMLLQQIAALKVYIGYAQKGYSIAQKGLKTVGDFKRREFGLHTNYFNSLKMVNPAIKNYARVAEILFLEAKVIETCNLSQAQLQQDGLFHGDETEYIKRVYERLLEDCEATLDELINVTTDNQLEMKDNERMKRIDALYGNMRDNYTFCQSFSNQVRLLSLSRAKESNDIKTGRAVQGINNN